MTRDGTVLMLEAIGHEAASLRERRKAFGPEGGTIGRAARNHWVLGGNYVSNHHARVSCRDGRFFIEDTKSTNGVSVNGRAIEPGRPHALESGDRLFIEPYDIVASIETTAMAADPFALLEPLPAAAPRAPAPLPPLPMQASGAGDRLPPDLVPVDDDPNLDPLAALDRLGAAPRDARRPPAAPAERPHVALGPLKESVQIAPPRVPAAVSEIPPNWWEIKEPPAGQVQPPVPDPPPAPAAERPKPQLSRPLPPKAAAPAVSDARADGELVDLSVLLAGAGLDGVRVTPEVAQQLGQILRVVVSGVLDVLQARQRTKEEFRIQGTVIRRQGNNPLKHSADVDDAMLNLFVKRSAAYLGPVEAFEDAFADLRFHQIAMLEGMRAAFQKMFERFDPSRLQDRFDRRGGPPRKGALAVLQGTPDYWERYREWMRDLTQDTDGSFRELFGEEFSRAYEEQLQRLKTAARPDGDTGRDRERGRRER